eukprot:CAMPEP_0202796758 /NCGR_PEP_ID=MMETSP1388-20130828/92743_1 /ASSEMBLY_ACC=CAM_ASM_000864 /TAXON_ID=37098 /ORGANISM="Isochrysis sp, Strain CCMP1244" /LENGTH=82 /DNA_ID=CAMNT_0049466659 /DNA_START=71 /DNA_END=317 /DNA_ORIENTATION=-
MGARSIATATLGPGPVSTSAETRSSNAAISNATAATPSTTAAVAIALATLAVAADPVEQRTTGRPVSAAAEGDDISHGWDAG